MERGAIQRAMCLRKAGLHTCHTRSYSRHLMSYDRFEMDLTPLVQDNFSFIAGVPDSVDASLRNYITSSAVFKKLQLETQSIPYYFIFSFFRAPDALIPCILNLSNCNLLPTSEFALTFHPHLQSIGTGKLSNEL